MLEHRKLVGWLKQQRPSRKMTMRDLASGLDKPHSFVAKVEQGERRLDVLEYVAYCNSLGVSPLKGLKATFSSKQLD